MKIEVLFFSLFCLFAHSFSATAREPLSLSDKNGRNIKGQVAEGSSPAHVNFTSENGRLFKDIPIDSFSAESQKAIRARIEEIKKELADAPLDKQTRLKISFQRRKAENNNDYGDIDDRVVKIQPRITIESEERVRSYKDLKGEVLIVGKEVVRKDAWVLLGKQKFRFAEIGPDQKQSWDGKEFEFRYDPDYGGFDYDGYLIVLFDKAGKVGMVKGSSSRFEQMSKELLAARKGTGYDKYFKKRVSLYTTFGLPE